jgi:hypothetical protein
VEWSGILFYTVKGDIRRPSRFTVILEGIHLMDIGSSAFTGFEGDDTIVEYMEQNNAWSQKRGLIHSHNTMKTFFSNTDMDEARDNVESYNYYLSVIVNNFGSYTGRMFFISERDKVPAKMKALDSNGKKYDIPIALRPVKYMCWYEADFQFNESLPSLPEVDKRIEVLSKRTKEVPRSTHWYDQQQELAFPNPWKDLQEEQNRRLLNPFDQKEPEEKRRSKFKEFSSEILESIKDQDTRDSIQSFLNYLVEEVLNFAKKDRNERVLRFSHKDLLRIGTAPADQAVAILENCVTDPEKAMNIIVESIDELIEMEGFEEEAVIILLTYLFMVFDIFGTKSISGLLTRRLEEWAEELKQMYLEDKMNGL